MSKKQGFTLMELLVVVAIIGLLAAIIMTAVVTPRKKARDAKGEAELREIQKALWLKYADLGRYPDLPDNFENIPADYSDLDPYLTKVPTDNGHTSYQWKGDDEHFCLIFKYETKEGYFACSEINCRIVQSGDCERPSQ